jgi:hypothetical protein
VKRGGPELRRMHDAIDISDHSNECFIQMFEMQPPRIAPSFWGGLGLNPETGNLRFEIPGLKLFHPEMTKERSPCQAITPVPPSSPPPNGCTPIAASAT